MFLVSEYYYPRLAFSRVRSRDRILQAGARPAARSRPLSESVCPVSLRASAPRVRSRHLAPLADDGACESARSGQGLLAVANSSATRARQRQHPPTPRAIESGVVLHVRVCVCGWGEDAVSTKEKG